jgi:putative pre-16S rRNA nuclease
LQAVSQSQPILPGRLAGIDYGTVRVGVAVTDARRTLASPYEIYRRRDKASDARYFTSLAEQEKIVGFVVGLPVHLDGHESQKSLEARQFGQWLAETTGRPVVYFDERFTTAEADQFLGAAKLTKKQRTARRDMLAAQIMLSAYLESTSHGEPGPLDDRPHRA